MVELTLNNLQAFDSDAEQRFIEKSRDRVRTTLVLVLNLAAEQSLADYYTDDQINQFTQLGIKRARGHNLLTEGEIFDYLWLMCWMGAFFDIDPHYRFIHSHINPTKDELKQGKTIHATFLGSRYIELLNKPINASLDRLEGLKEDTVEGHKNEMHAKHNRSERNAKQLLSKVTLIDIVKYYIPMNKVIHDDEGVLEAIYAQAQPHSLHFYSRSSHIAWFMLSLEKGYRFYDNPLYSKTSELLREHTRESVNKGIEDVGGRMNSEAEIFKITQIIDVFISKSAQL